MSTAAQCVNALLGIWLMAAPTVLAYGGTARVNDLIVGPIVANFAIIAIWDVCRSIGKVNMALGLWLLAAPWMLGYQQGYVIINSSVTGAAIFLMALMTGAPQGRYGGGWSSLWKENALPDES